MDSVYTRKRGSDITTCRKCSKTLDRQGQCCQGCVEEERKQRQYKRRDVKVCVREGCNNKPTFSSSLCKDHQKERHLVKVRLTNERLNQIVSCEGCGCDLGKRRNFKLTKYCKDCKKQKQLKHNKKWREKNTDWVKKYNKEYYSQPKWRKYSVEYTKKNSKKYSLLNNTCVIEGCNEEIGFKRNIYCDKHGIRYGNYTRLRIQNLSRRK